MQGIAFTQIAATALKEAKISLPFLTLMDNEVVFLASLFRGLEYETCLVF